MSDTGKLAYAIIGVFVIGFAMVGFNKMTASDEQREGAAMIRSYVALQTMAGQKCPAAIKDATGEQVYFPSDTESDRDTFITLKWVGEKGFKTASCTIRTLVGGISELKIDDKTLISKQAKP
jgi:hypothetical protein